MRQRAPKRVMNRNIIKDLPEAQRPYEKCFSQGEAALSDCELLAVILRSGTQGLNSLELAQEILQYMETSSYTGLTGLLHISGSGSDGDSRDRAGESGSA